MRSVVALLMVALPLWLDLQPASGQSAYQLPEIAPQVPMGGEQ